MMQLGTPCCQKVIIFDGPDRCGKTNMAHALASQLNIPYFKNDAEHYAFAEDTNYFKQATTYIDPYMASFLAQTNQSVIFDRAWPSEWCYSGIFNRETITDDKFLLLDQLWAKIDTTIIIPYRNSYEGISDPIHHNITSNVLQQLEQKYQQFHEWTTCRSLRLNVDAEDLIWELNMIKDFLASDIRKCDIDAVR